MNAKYKLGFTEDEITFIIDVINPTQEGYKYQMCQIRMVLMWIVLIT